LYKIAAKKLPETKNPKADEELGKKIEMVP